MLDSDIDRYSGVLPWVCVFGGLQRKIDSLVEVGDE